MIQNSLLTPDRFLKPVRGNQIVVRKRGGFFGGDAKKGGRK
jgi:hypothetical protein